MKTRLFIGNLASTVTEQELKEKFDSLLSSHKGEAEVGNAEVRCKNENNYFGFVDIHVNQKDDEGAGGGGNNGIPFFLRKYIDLMNNTKWKGSLIKVQVAKESFIDKLKREQQENRNKTEAGSSDSRNGVYAEFTDRRNTNGENSEISRNQKQANDILYKLNRQRDRGHRGNNRFQDRNARAENSGDCGFEIVSNSVITTKQSPQKDSPRKGSPPNKGSKKRPISSSSSEDDSDDEVRDGIPKFKGLLLCYPEGLPPPPVQEEPKVKISEEAPPEEDREIQKKLLSIALNKEITEIPKVQTTKQVPPSKSAINFKKNKQQQSDLLRLQSLEKMKELKAQRKNLIKSSLSSVTASAPVTEQRKLLKGPEEDANDNDEIERKKPKMTLFDDSDDDDNDQDSEAEGDAFKLKKQFEGAGGQKLLELKTRWGNDDRFKIDDRFKESDGEEELEPAEQEKEKQLDILTGILGKVVSTKGAPAKGKKGTTQAIASSSVIMPRYDPEADNESEDKAKNKQDDDKSKKSAKGEEKSNSSTEVAEKVVRSTEPATFKTVSNLKSLFSSSTGEDNDKGTQNTDSVFKSSVPEQQSSFSLLATFGQKTDDEDGERYKKSGASKSSSLAEAGPRSFWQSNPFRYDSSDDEGDNVKVTIKSKPEKPTSSSLVVHGKTPFFFSENDTRFEGLEDYFLKSDEASNAVNGVDGDNADAKKDPIEEYSIKRQELKSIVKAKIRNTRRKDEKRTLAIKRAIRKRKRKIHQKGRVFNKQH